MRQRLIRFLLVGVLNTGFSYSLYALFLWMGIHFIFANLFATALGVIFSFRTQGVFVFGNRDWHLIWRFIPVWVFIYTINVTLIALILQVLPNAYVAGALALPPTVILSFLLQRRFVFAVPKSVYSESSR